MRYWIRVVATGGEPDRDLGAVLNGLVADRVPGLAAAVVEKDEVRWIGAAGTADLATARATTPDTAHLWFSMTKIVTATAAMQLVQDGVLSLEDLVERHLPEFPRPRRGWPEVRLWHLLSHSAGLANPMPLRWVHPAGEPGRDPHEFALGLLRRHRRLRFPAGSRAVYSNLGYVALGEVIGSAAGRPYEDHVRTRILEPLGMECTGFSFASDAAIGYQLRRSPLTPLMRLMLPAGTVGAAAGRFVAFRPFCVDGAAYGGLIGSVRDAARFMAVHLGGAATTGVLRPESIAAMQEIRASGRKLDVGLGWYRRRAHRGGEPHLEHRGGGGGFFSMMRIYPRAAVGVVVMGNATGYDYERVAAAVAARYAR